MEWNDYDKKDLNRKLCVKEYDNSIIKEYNTLVKRYKRKKTICFCSTIEHTARMVKLFKSKGISPTAVPSGDYWDSAEEDGIRVAGKVPITYVGTASATTIKAVDAGLDYVGDTAISGGTGSTAVAAFSAAFTAVPRVIGQIQATATSTNVLGSGSSLDLSLAGIATGSAIFLGVSGAAVQWIAYGDKY